MTEKVENELEKLLRAIGKKNPLIYKASDQPDLGTVSTGLQELDSRLHGGWPLGRQVTLFGRYGSAKSSLALYSVADAQAKGLSCLWIDAEGSFDKAWAESLGVDTDNLALIRSRALEAILGPMQVLEGSGFKFDVIVVDSISSIQGIKFFEDDSHQIGSQARATKEFIMKASYWFPESLRIMISQVTTETSGKYFVQAPTGGHALRHENSYQLYLHYANSDQKKGTVQVGDRTINKEVAYVDISWLFSKARSDLVGERGVFRFIPGTGVDRIEESFRLGRLCGAIKVSAVTKFGGRTWRSMDAMMEEMRQDQSLLEEVRGEILARGIDSGGGAGEEGADSSEEVD